MKTILRRMLLPGEACSALCLLVTGCCRQVPLTLLHNTPQCRYLETEEQDELFPESHFPCLSIHADDFPRNPRCKTSASIHYAKTSCKMSQSFEAAKYGLRHLWSLRKFTGLWVTLVPMALQFFTAPQYFKCLISCVWGSGDFTARRFMTYWIYIMRIYINVTSDYLLKVWTINVFFRRC